MMLYDMEHETHDMKSGGDTILRGRYDSTDIVYDKGVTIIETDDSDPGYKKVKIGDGITYYGSLPSIYDSDQIRNELSYESYKHKQEMEVMQNQLKSEMEFRLSELSDKMNRSITYIHSCKSCGAKLEVPENKNVFCCKYCGSSYVVGPVRLNSVV